MGLTAYPWLQRLQAGGGAAGDVWRRASLEMAWDGVSRARTSVRVARPNRLHDTACAAVEPVCERAWPIDTARLIPGPGGANQEEWVSISLS